IWSTKFNSIFSVFDQNLSYDDSLYKIFYDLWSKQNKQHINLYNDNSLATNMDTISNFMTHNSFNAIMSCRNFTKSINNALAYFFNEPVTPTFSREHIEILVKHIADYQTTSLGPDPKHQLNIILNKSYPLMLHHYSDTVRTLLNPSHHGRQPTSLSHASLSELIIGDFIFDLSSKCTSKNLTLFKSIEHLLSAERLDSELIGAYQAQSLEPLNMLAHDFLTPLMAKMLLNSEQRLDLTLNFYDLKLSLIHSLTNYIWSNHTLLSNKKSKIDQINKELLQQVRSELSFVTSSEIEHYLFERGFDRRFLTKPDCPRANLLVYGLFYLIMYCPMGPLDPVEHDVLVQKNQLAVSHTRTHLEYLGRKNLTCRHKICLEPEPVDAHDQLTDRLNKPVYYLIKNEIENFLKQFLAYDQVWSLWSNNRPSDQFSTWLNSIESLINKLKSYYNYSDVIGRPVRGLSLIWHAMSSMYTERRAQTNELALELMQYPVMDSYVEIAERMSEVKSNDMHLVALMNGVNSVLVESVGSDRLTRLVVKVCDHFSREYFEHKRKRDEDEQVDAYKYKQYGQEKIEQELEERELESKFPSYEHNFSEFIQMNVLDDEKKKETKIEKDSFVCLFDQVYDLISRIYEPCKNEKFILDTFLKSYTIGTGMIRDTIIQNSHKNTLLSHILFSTSVNLREEKKLFDIYHDSNCEQVLALKKCLDSLTKRIESVLREWPQNPVLVELTKIVNKIESFNLNDPLMKYLTGIELLLGRADSWQLIASRDVSLDSELKALNHLVVEWRKLELKQWMNSCESEMDKIKKENAFVWFFTIYSTCSEYLGAQDQSDDKLVSTLFQFMASAPIGQFSMRLKSIHVCHLIFSKFECAKSKSLNKMLWSVWSFYESLYSGGVRALIAKHQADIDKELRDFVTIYKWQDATYWSIKNSVAKSNRHFVRTIKKFKADRVCHAPFVNEPATSHYAGKMQKFCSTILSRKFKKNKFNRLCSVFVDNVRQRFDGLAQETRQLTNGFVSDKKNASKYKKEFKYLNQEKLKFMSDLIKRLNLMGLSYRKGQIMATRYTHIEQVILGHKTQLNSHFEFYLSARRFFDYKSNRPSQQAVNLPLDKFNGYVNHLFSFVHSQRLSLTKLSLHMAQLAGLNCKLATIVKLNASSWSSPTSNVKSMYLKLNWAYAKIRKLLIQMKYFYENLFNLGQSEIVLSITNEFDQVKCALENVLNLIPGEKSEDELEYANELSDYVIDRDPLMHLGSLIQKHCEPFYEYYSECIAQLDCVDLDAQAVVVDEPIAHHSSEHHSIEHCVQRTKTKVLKIVENFYKKYSHYVIKELESDHFFTLESLHNFTSDCESLQLDTLVKQIRKILSLGLTNRTGLVDHVTNLKSVLDVFWRYVSAYEQHLSQVHVKCCQMVETLVKVFDEYKQGLSVPKELEQDDNESAENETDEKKFSTDDAAGLGEGQGSKDVSDQIENEDQLDDAKTKEQREEDDQEEEQADKVDEEEKGIEMSEDFEAKMDDVNMDEEAEQEDKEDEEDLDDEKGDVDNAMDYLDEQLWDKEDNEAEQEGQDEENDLDEDIHGGDKLEDTSELMAKEQDLPMIDNEENKTQDDEERAPEHNDDEQSANEKNEQDIDLMKEGSDDEMKEEMEEEKGKENEQANEEEKENGEEEEEEVEKMPEENQIEEMESLAENGEQKEEEEKGEKNLNENSKNYGCNEPAEKSENESNKLNWCGDAEDNEQMSDEQNEADVNQEADNEKSVGQGQNELSVNSAQTDQAESRQSKMRQKNQNRVLDDQEQKLDAIKDLNIVDVSEEEMGDDPNETSDQKGVEFKHLNDQDEKSDQKMYDAATDEQKKPQRAERHQQDEQIKLDQEESRVDQKENKKLNAKQFEENKQKEEAEDVDEQNSESKDEKMKEADFVSTMNAQRPSESVFATLKDNLVVDISRETVERDLAKFKEVSVHEMVDCESLKLWLEYEAITQQLSRELCEQLRLILEPTICSKLKGDYKTGKRLNMKRVVEYIATEYRKDKIWLRRTKPNKRDYQVVLAVDNSSSMSDNHCMQLAYETIATLTNAFSLLEVGQFGLVSFGEKVEPLHALSEHFNSNVGARILSNINFNHERTKIA
ncbi:Midasin, partial [Brachionus plicatilis]